MATSETPKHDYRTTLNLLTTDFAQRAKLPQREPDFLKRWEDSKLYDRIREARKGAETFILHDGPPYANGEIHLGTALNKVLKDIVVKYKTMRGFDAPYVPGWDCHGLPIENEVEKKLGSKVKEMDRSSFRQACKDWADKFIGVQRDDFMRLGVLGQWWEPYLTLNRSYEKAIVNATLNFFHQGSIYRSLKPVHWCVVHQTALAEAEIEYKEHVSPSIYVAFTAKSGSVDGVDLAAEQVGLVIWTTTPWTLPANKAIVVHPKFSYVLVEAVGRKFIVAEDLLTTTAQAAGWAEHTVLKTFPGEALEGAIARHPFYEQDSPVFLADYVTLEQGTGLVHTAPGHGMDDYHLGIREGLEVYNPVNDDGTYKEDVQFFAGQHVFKANDAICQHMSEHTDALLHHSKFTHQYPHSWRSKKPVIFRATNQWFISMAHNDLRQKALEWIDKSTWLPPQGRERIHAMVTQRPDWCISRQRTWGVPITLFVNAETDEPLRDKAVYDKVLQEVGEHGAEVWFEKPAEYFFGDGYKCPETGATEFKKVMDILDVWFESGVSHDAVLNHTPGLHWPADLYLEGSDQHRGWFQHSLLCGVGTKGGAPFKAVLTHGFVVDQKGKKMSKSLGNVVKPQKLVDEAGADVVRMWIAGEDFRTDVRFGQEIFARAKDSYRKIRNTIRFLLGNLSDFDPAQYLVSFEKRNDIDRWIMGELRKLLEQSYEAYDNYEFYVVEKALHNFCAGELSAVYLDITRDRLYCEDTAGDLRRSTQSSVYELAVALAKLWAPICPVTAEEIWDALPDQPEDSVHLAVLPELDTIPHDAELGKRWERLLAMREEVNAALELQRKEKVIGAPLDAHLIIDGKPEDVEFLNSFGEELRNLCIVSKLTVGGAGDGAPTLTSEEVSGLKVWVTKAPGEKCQRCWTWSEELGTNPEHPELCPRCTGVVMRSFAAGE